MSPLIDIINPQCNTNLVNGVHQTGEQNGQSCERDQADSTESSTWTIDITVIYRDIYYDIKFILCYKYYTCWTEGLSCPCRGGSLREKKIYFLICQETRISFYSLLTSLSPVGATLPFGVITCILNFKEEVARL